MRRWCLSVPTLLAALLVAMPARAQPPAASLMCESYPQIPLCASGAAPCTTCHTVAPARNLYGLALEGALAPDAERPLPADVFVATLPDALARVASLDADDDGVTNLDELRAGSDPSDASSRPRPADNASCTEATPARPSGFDVCAWDPVYVFKKVRVDFCGQAPTLEDIEAFARDATAERLGAELDRCLDSEAWIARDGTLWRMAHEKIIPAQAIKSGANPGPIEIADYEDDYNFFVHAMIDGHDVRRLLTGDDFVRRIDPSSEQVATTYEAYQASALQEVIAKGQRAAQLVARERRAGLLTHRWFLSTAVMFASIPRTAAAQAYRAYLGHDLAQLEGLAPVQGEPRDYDAKGVDRAECAVCHTTLDPLSYPFSRYEGIGGGTERLGDGYVPFSYNAERLDRFAVVDGPTIIETPEAGAVLGQPVADLVEWAQVAANSDDFAQKVVLDFWVVLLGEPPRPDELEAFESLWRGLMGVHDYNVEAMLHELVRTEAYGVP